MRARVKFAKYGAMKFIGHLELMRFLHGAVRRAGLPVKYDEGMRRRMVMSFAMPLGVGPASSAEYMDIEMDSPVPTAEAMRLLGEQMCEGLQILDFREVDDSKRMKAMTIVAAAEYDVCFREGYEPDWDWQEGLLEMLGMENIPWTKETKKGTRELDMRPLIYWLEMCDLVLGEDGRLCRREELFEEAEAVEESEVTEVPEVSEVSEVPEGKCSAGDKAFKGAEGEGSQKIHRGFHACLCCSVGDNLKPEQLIGKLYEMHGKEIPPYALIVHRADLLTRQDEKLVSLGELGHRIHSI